MFHGGGSRITVTCANTWSVQYVAAFHEEFLGSNNNLIGNIFGSQDLAALNDYNLSGYQMSQVNQVVALCGPTPCGTRSYDSAAYAYDLGFGEAADDGTEAQIQVQDATARMRTLAIA